MSQKGTNGLVVELVDLTVEFEGRRVLDRVSGRFRRGVITAIIGPNGAGKTTMLRAILGLVPYRGKIRFPGRSEREARAVIGYVPQKLSLARELPLRVLDFMTIGGGTARRGVLARPYFWGPGRKARRRAMELLKITGAADLWDRNLGALSGGELQRVLLALALDPEPELLLLDEPAAGIDVEGEHRLYHIFDDLAQRRQVSVMIVTHHIQELADHVQEVFCLERHSCCQGHPAEVLSPERVAAIFGEGAGALVYRHRHGHESPAGPPGRQAESPAIWAASRAWPLLVPPAAKRNHPRRREGRPRR